MQRLGEFLGGCVRWSVHLVEEQRSVQVTPRDSRIIRAAIGPFDI